jgi:hypothetical protein
MHWLRALGSRDHEFESHTGYECLVFVCVCFSVFVYRWRPCDELITRPRSPTECLRSRNPKWNREFHGGRPREKRKIHGKSIFTRGWVFLEKRIIISRVLQSWTFINETDLIGEGVTLLTHIREVLGSNFGRDTGYHDRGFSWFSSVPTGKWRSNKSIRPGSLPAKSFSQLITSLLYHSRYLNRRILNKE